ncbi:methionine biosynthesis protein MetW [Opitutus terrae]|uniref:Methionine biosynthesis MetW protein n=1 Tax=Opitutus terrae (strain DSM 11246 / JCM 15787 / PB90-1) TaxID=452637 RepID=B1ZSQ4_OPITP|nr:methionine biosynthesis protein MetW [Opitutus terrae]ACB74753.1 Methionine biosynthesis MetW protein [Opitutus terrae PB90-1]
MSKPVEKRAVDMEIIAEWVEPASRVLDLGCGRGDLLAYLVQTKDVRAVGVDLDFRRITACVARGLSAYQGDMTGFMREFPDRHFDRVICSRTVQELDNPTAVILEALRAGHALTVGFVNHGFWKNRADALLRGRKVRNDVYTTEWFESRPSNPVSIADFEHFCAVQGITVTRRVYLRGDWHTPCRFRPNFFAGYALYDLRK